MLKLDDMVKKSNKETLVSSDCIPFRNDVRLFLYIIRPSIKRVSGACESDSG